jgi:hypothetical protein
MRPDSGTKTHASWFQLHSNLGRVVCILGIANVFIGTFLIHDVQVRGACERLRYRGAGQQSLLPSWPMQVARGLTYDS